MKAVLMSGAPTTIVDPLMERLLPNELLGDGPVSITRSVSVQKYDAREVHP